MNLTRSALLWGLLLSPALASAEFLGEAGEPTLEELDAAFSPADAAREAAGWSEVIPERVESSVDALAASSDLVVRGTVTDQSYTYDEEGIPFTHTTISISEVIKGGLTGSEITLVQEGGPDRDNPERVRMVSSAQYFAPGEESVLFLDEEEGARGAAGGFDVRRRFRVFQGHLYTQSGRGVILQPPGDRGAQRLGLSRNRHPADVFREVHVGGHTLTRQYGGRDGVPDSQSGVAGSSAAAPGYEASADVASFTAAIRD